MENASKALIMAGGILIALLVIGALVLMFNQLSYYQRTETDSEKTQQLADFNKEYLKYTYDDIKGYELISLVNKVIDYNIKEEVGNSVDYTKKITVVINMKEFKSKYGVKNITSLFTKDTYTINNSNTIFSADLNNFRSMENTYTLSAMNKLSANYDTLKQAKAENQNSYETKIKEIVGKVVKNNSGNTISLTEIEQYREYSEFKSSTFKPGNVEYHNNGQVKQLSFEFKN
ncbi:MAG: hypothetical protein BHW00_05480 [Clostridium sp. 26_22]|jgi:hypothetical protein|nr:MAG: hypothetical protein BHW00_05480 [Clostridium sp. 26_22]